MRRTDPHRPSAINPDEYKFVGFECLKIEDIGDAQYLISQRVRIRAHMAETGGTYSQHQHGGNCHVCGASAIYTALFHHAPTNSYVRTGLACADKLDYCDVEVFRRHVRLALEATAGKKKAKALLETTGIPEAWEVYLNLGESERREEPTIRDIVAHLVQYGSLSDKQWAYLRTLVARIDSRDEDDARRAAERDAAEPVPETLSRLMIEGEVLTVRMPNFDRYNEDTFLEQPRILVRVDAGYKLWGTRPRSMRGVKVGDRVQFSATVKRSQKDEKFGFFSRPTKGLIVASTEA